MTTVRIAKKIEALPPYLFARIDAAKEKVVAQGKKIIDLSIGDPDLPTPPHIVAALKEAVDHPATHRYPPYAGTGAFREAAAAWCRRYHGLTLDPASEVLCLIGSKEGIAHAPLAFINPGDVVLIPSPGYPVYPVATALADGVPYIMPLRAENHFLPDYDAIPPAILKKARLMFLNYPNNPTGAVATREFLAKTVAFAKAHQITIAHDAAYLEIFYGAERPLSLLSIEGAKEITIEFHSLSKTFCMTGWRIGFAIGAPRLIAALGKLKTNIDSGIFGAVQAAGAAALNAGDGATAAVREIFEKRRHILVEGLRKGGLGVTLPPATFYVWARVPAGFSSESFAIHLLEHRGIMATPGSGFGAEGEGYVRFSLTRPTEKITEAAAWLSHI